MGWKNGCNLLVLLCGLVCITETRMQLRNIALRRVESDVNFLKVQIFDLKSDIAMLMEQNKQMSNDSFDGVFQPGGTCVSLF